MTKRKDLTLRSRAINTNMNTLSEIPLPKKVIRDTFSIPLDEHNLIDQLRNQCMLQGIQMNKGEIIRAGLKALNNLTPEELKEISSAVEKVKTGRPKK